MDVEFEFKDGKKIAKKIVCTVDGKESFWHQAPSAWYRKVWADFR